MPRFTQETEQELLSILENATIEQASRRPIVTAIERDTSDDSVIYTIWIDGREVDKKGEFDLLKTKLEKRLAGNENIHEPEVVSCFSDNVGEHSIIVTALISEERALANVMDRFKDDVNRGRGGMPLP